MSLSQILESPFCVNISGRKACISKSLRALIFLSLLSILLVPAYIVFFFSPTLNGLLIDHTEDDAVRAAKQLILHLNIDTAELTKDTVPTELTDKGQQIITNLELWKLKLFSSTGEIIYSSDPEDIGKINRKSYFVDIVANGDNYTKQVKKDSQTLEGQIVSVDVVETYVPILRDNRFMGAFEIYYDVSASKSRLHNLMMKVYIVLSTISIFIFLAIIKISLKARKNIIERKQYEERLHKIAMTDELTDLFNRRGFLAMAENQVNIAERMGEELYLLYADIDNLKWINDNLGHKIGDLAIVEAADVLRMTFRKTDILSRVGGDEFAVLLTCDPDENRKETAIQRLEENLKLRNGLAGREYELHISTGIIYCGSKSPCSIQELVSRADLLMYKNKKNKKINSIVSSENYKEYLTFNISFIHQYSDFYPTCI